MQVEKLVRTFYVPQSEAIAALILCENDVSRAASLLVDNPKKVRFAFLCFGVPFKFSENDFVYFWNTDPFSVWSWGLIFGVRVVSICVFAQNLFAGVTLPRKRVSSNFFTLSHCPFIPRSNSTSKTKKIHPQMLTKNKIELFKCPKRLLKSFQR